MDDQFHTFLIHEILEGNTNRFAVLVEKYESHVARIVFRHIPAGRAPEVAQEIFVRAFRSLRQYQGIKPFRHWLSKIAMASCFDFWREEYKRPEMPISSLSDDCREAIDRVLATRSEQEFSRKAETRELAELLEWALGRLSPEDRMVLTMTYFEGYTLAEAAEFLDWTLSNAKVHSHRARQKLRDLLAELIPGHQRNVA